MYHKNIMRLCLENGISGGKLCDEVGVSRGFLSDLKAGRKNGMALETAQKIADYFSVSVSDVLEGKKEAPAAETATNAKPEPTGTIDRELIAALLDLTPEQEQQALNYIRFLKSQQA